VGALAVRDRRRRLPVRRKHEWIKPWGISWHLGVDGISLFLVVLTGILFPIAMLGVDPHHDHKRYYAWLLLLEAG
jgi:NADH-quinone oxidoreductase subunit M